MSAEGPKLSSRWLKKVNGTRPWHKVRQYADNDTAETLAFADWIFEAVVAPGGVAIPVLTCQYRHR